MVPRGSVSQDRVKLQLVRPEVPSSKFDKLSMKSGITIVGLMIGGVVGFLLRPSLPFIGQLPFTTVITRGGNLQGLDQLLIGYARTSFNYLIVGIVVGAVVGLIAAFVMSNQNREPR
jgi:hypothetical protein